MQATLRFSEPPSDVVGVQKGQFGYKRDTSIRLRGNKDGLAWFPIQGRKYVEDPDDPCLFHLK